MRPLPLHRLLGRERGQAALEGLYTVLVIMLFLWGTFALATLIWASTVVRTTTSLAAQSALIAYQDVLYEPTLYASGEFESAIRPGGAADTAARKAGSRVMAELASQSSVLRLLNVNLTTCAGAPALIEVVARPSADRKSVTLVARTRMKWQATSFFSGCLEARSDATAALTTNPAEVTQ